MKPHLTNAIGKLRLCSWVGWSFLLILCIALTLSKLIHAHAQNYNCDPGYHYNAATGNCDPDTPAAPPLGNPGGTTSSPSSNTNTGWWNSLNDGTKGILIGLGVVGAVWILTLLGGPPTPENAPAFTFNATSFPGFYDASHDNKKGDAYNIPAMLEHKQDMWDSYGVLFKRVGSDLGMDPYALAAYCVFESYNVKIHNFDTSMVEHKGNMYAAGIAATQAQEVKGTNVPGLSESLPDDTLGAVDTLCNKPEYSIRYLAQEFKVAYNKEKDLAKAFPIVADPRWKDPNKKDGNYGTQAQYVSRAFVFYKAFRAADGK